MAFTPKAFLFDLNGTMINDMDYHSRAWFNILNNDLNGNFSMAEVKQNMYGKNQELLVRMFGADRFTQEEMDNLSVEKEKRYQQAYLPQLPCCRACMNFWKKLIKPASLWGLGLLLFRSILILCWII